MIRIAPSLEINYELFKVQEDERFVRIFSFEVVDEDYYAPYVFVKVETVVTISYDGVNLLNMFFKTGLNYKSNDPSLPKNDLCLGVKDDKKSITMWNFGHTHDYKRQEELIKFFNLKLKHAGRKEKLEYYEVNYLYKLLFNKLSAIEYPEDLNCYLYTVRVELEEISRTFNKLEYSEYVKLFRELPSFNIKLINIELK